jgi:hypothetical protein
VADIVTSGTTLASAKSISRYDGHQMVHNLRLELDIDVEAIEHRQDSLKNEMPTLKDGGD